MTIFCGSFFASLPFQTLFWCYFQLKRTFCNSYPREALWMWKLFCFFIILGFSLDYDLVLLLLHTMCWYLGSIFRHLTFAFIVTSSSNKFPLVLLFCSQSNLVSDYLMLCSLSLPYTSVFFVNFSSVFFSFSFFLFT